jgi:hypothetical protein
MAGAGRMAGAGSIGRSCAGGGLLTVADVTVADGARLGTVGNCTSAEVTVADGFLRFTGPVSSPCRKALTIKEDGDSGLFPLPFRFAVPAVFGGMWYT